MSGRGAAVATEDDDVRAPDARGKRQAAVKAAAAVAAMQDIEGGNEERALPQSPPAKGTATNGGGRKKGGKAAAQAPTGPMPVFAEDEIDEARGALVGWYDRVHRVLPWRRNPHSKLPAGSDGPDAPQPAPEGLSPQDFAYRVWVSEIMLQQTQVATVIPYFQRWLARWPTVADLAAASQEDVNQQWAGLGYYRRARYLLEGARHVMDKLGGAFPETAVGMREIPGVGPYTAAAVASIAFGDGAAAVDGNVIRVISRLRALRGDPTKNGKAIEALAAQLLHPERPGCHNQAMMELGATVCKPTNPSCGSCPVSSVCAAAKLVATHVADGGDPAAEGAPKVTDFPEKVAKAAKKEQHVAVCVVKAWVPAAAGQGEASAGGSSSEKKEAPPAAKKRRTQQQGSILAFLAPAGGAGGGAGASSTGGGGANGKGAAAAAESEEDLQRGGAVPYYLLVQRPPQGLLAGLWECPGVVMGDEDAASATGTGAAAATRRRSLADALLSRLGVETGDKAGGVSVVSRRHLGSVVHIFSHIRQTAHVEQLVVSAPSLAAVCASATAAAAGAAGDGSRASGSGAAENVKPPAKRRKGGDDEEGGSGDEGGGSGDKGIGGAAAGPTVLRWVAQRDLLSGDEGLTSGVRKVLSLAHALQDGGDAKGKGGKGKKAAADKE